MYFNAYIKTRQIERYQLLILDSYKSYLNQNFKDYYLENKILTLYILPYLLYILQLLNIVYFLLLKRKYLQRVRDLVRRRVFYINKEGFLLAFKDAFFNVFIIENYYKAFKVLELISLNAQVILDYLTVQLRTLLEYLLLETLQQLKTLSNIYKFRSQLKLVHESFTQLPVTV